MHDEPPAYHSGGFTGELYKPEVMKTIEGKLDSLDAELRELSLKIHGNDSSTRRIIYQTY